MGATQGRRLPPLTFSQAPEARPGAGPRWAEPPSARRGPGSPIAQACRSPGPPVVPDPPAGPVPAASAAGNSLARRRGPALRWRPPPIPRRRDQPPVPPGDRLRRSLGFRAWSVTGVTRWV